MTPWGVKLVLDGVGGHAVEALLVHESVHVEVKTDGDYGQGNVHGQAVLPQLLEIGAKGRLEPDQRAHSLPAGPGGGECLLLVLPERDRLLPGPFLELQPGPVVAEVGEQELRYVLTGRGAVEVTQHSRRPSPGRITSREVAVGTFS